MMNLVCRLALGTVSGASLAFLTACGMDRETMDTYAKTYESLPGHKAMFLNTDNSRFIWVSDKGTQLDAIQLGQILCKHAASSPDDCVLVYVDGHQLFDPVDGVAIPPDSSDLADVLYEAGVPMRDSH